MKELFNIKNLLPIVLAIGFAVFTSCEDSKENSEDEPKEDPKETPKDEPEDPVYDEPLYDEPMEDKPVIYLYPEVETQVQVELDYTGEFTCTYPSYGNGWDVIASPDGKLISSENGKEYSYLFWEGKSGHKWDIKEGFVVKGENTADFLQEKLSLLGLTPKEYNEFIVYWLPKMEGNNFNLIHFAEEEYQSLAKLHITPTPQTIIRVFMVCKALDDAIDIPTQTLTPQKREGFTVIEWGGTDITHSNPLL